jgi:hypothetical protein
VISGIAYSNQKHNVISGKGSYFFEEKIATSFARFSKLCKVTITIGRRPLGKG